MNECWLRDFRVRRIATTGRRKSWEGSRESGVQRERLVRAASIAKVLDVHQTYVEHPRPNKSYDK